MLVIRGSRHVLLIDSESAVDFPLHFLAISLRLRAFAVNNV